jgi:hypothetical protein
MSFRSSNFDEIIKQRYQNVAGEEEKADGSSDASYGVL